LIVIFTSAWKILQQQGLHFELSARDAIQLWLTDCRVGGGVGDSGFLGVGGTAGNYQNCLPQQQKQL